MTQFRRAGYGFWGSIGEWIREVILCVCLNHHDRESDDQGRWHCRRCGVATQSRGRDATDEEFRAAYAIEKPRWAQLAKRLK